MRMRRYDQLDRAAAADGGRSVAMAVVVAEEDEDRGGRGEGIHQCRLPTKGRIPQRDGHRHGQALYGSTSKAQVV
jgi:hypothetical protein